ncbi:CRAL-TRIO domain-containing protein [Pisolithus albus]|nr:CRAL-TRIO domain-containing protein [Pisolithus albus]
MTGGPNDQSASVSDSGPLIAPAVPEEDRHPSAGTSEHSAVAHASAELVQKTTPENDNDEPQNALTKKFTAAEWSALRKFRSMLPATFTEAFPDRPDASSTSYVLWGVTIDPTKPKDARVSVVLMKFLRARNLNPDEAKAMFISTLRWRQSFDVEGAIKEQYPEDVFGGLGKIFGKDKQGHPVVYNLYGGAKDTGAFNDIQRFLRWRVAFMERSIALLDFETVDQAVQIHDYEGVGLFDRNENSKRAASEATSIFQGHYPELLARKFFVNVPSFMTWIFWLFKPLISSATLGKMAVVGSGPRTIGAALLPIIDERELPKRYGGSAEGF